MKANEVTYKGFKLTIQKKTAIDGVEWFVIWNDTTKHVVAKFKLKRDAIYHLNNFENNPILPL